MGRKGGVWKLAMTNVRWLLSWSSGIEQAFEAKAPRLSYLNQW